MGGCGILSALGIRFFNDEGQLLPLNPSGLASLTTIDTSQLDVRIPNCEIIILCDVNNQLLGPEGSAAIFGPQKGATPADVLKLEHFLVRLDAVVEKQFGKKLSALKYGGAAGGAAAGLCAFLNAKLVNGIEHFLQITGFEGELSQCDLVLTGEGSIDHQTLQGKGPYGVAKLAKQKNIPVIGLAGKTPLVPGTEMKQYFDILMAIGNGPASLDEALAQTRENLVRTSILVGDAIAIGLTSADRS